MRRGRLLALATAASGLLMAAGSITAAAADSPVPGTPSGVSATTQPAAASVGGSAEPNSSATVATGRTTSTAEGQNVNQSSCGAGVGAAGNNFGAQPTSGGTSGTSTPTCTGAATGSSGGQGANANSAQTQSSGGQASTGSGQSTDLASTGLVSSRAGDLMANTFKLGWLLLALLLAGLFFLFGAAVARRRRPAESA